MPPGSKSVLFLLFKALKLFVQGCSPVEQGLGFSDRLKKPLNVKPEGIPVEKVQSEFKCLDNSVDKVGGIFFFNYLSRTFQKKEFLNVFITKMGGGGNNFVYNILF